MSSSARSALGRPRIVIVGTEEIRGEFAATLTTEVQEAIIGCGDRRGARRPTPSCEEAVLPPLEQWRSNRENGAVERWREEAGRSARASSGWEKTLEAASDGRVELLLYQEGVQKNAFRCPACGRAALAASTCPLDGTTMEPRDDGLDLAVRQTLAHGGDVLAVRGRRDLDPVEGVGAILRF